MSTLSRQTGHTITKSTIASIIIGAIVLIYGLSRVIPTFLEQQEEDAFMNNAAQVNAVCVGNEAHDYLYNDITAQYEYEGDYYEVTFTDILIGKNAALLEPGDVFVTYVNKDDPSQAFYIDDGTGEELRNQRNIIYIRYGIYTLGGFISLIAGISSLIRKKRSATNIPATYSGYQGSSTPGGMIGGSIPSYNTVSSPSDTLNPTTNNFTSPMTSHSANNFTSTFTSNSSSSIKPTFVSIPSANNSPMQSNPTQPISPSPMPGVPAQPMNMPPMPGVPAQPMNMSPMSGVPAQPMNMPPMSGIPTQPMNMPPMSGIPTQPMNMPPMSGSNVTPPKTTTVPPFNPAMAAAGAAAYTAVQQTPKSSKPFSTVPPAPQPTNQPPAKEKAVMPDSQKKKSTSAPAPIDSTDLSSIIKSGSDDAFNMSADDYKADEKLAAIIKSGSDDAFNMSADDYQADEKLAAIIKSGSDDAFNMSADDYQADEKLASIIKSGSDDAFNMSADDYQADEKLASIIKSGSDDAFNMSADDFKADEKLAALIKNGSDDQPLQKIEPEPDDDYDE